MTPGLCSALVLVLALCTGLSVNRHGCLCKQKWNRGDGSCMRRRGSFIFESLTPRPPRTALLPKQGLWMALKLPFDSGSLDFLTLEHREKNPVRGARPMSVALWWDCFLAMLSLLTFRAQPCHVGPWWIFHPSCLTVHIRQFSLCACCSERAAFREPFISIPNRTNKPSFYEWPSDHLCANGVRVVIPTVVVVVVVICRASRYFQSVIWSFTPTVSLWVAIAVEYCVVMSYGIS